MSDPDAEEELDPAGGVVQHFRRQCRLHANPERVLHDDLGVGQLTRDAVVLAHHRGLTRQVAGKQQARADLVLVQIRQQVHAPHLCFGAKRNRESEPGWVGARRGFRQDQEFLAGGQPFLQEAEIGLALRHEFFDPVHLRQSASGLHIGDFQVVPDVRIRVLVVIAFRQAAQLLTEALAAGVVLARSAIAITPPIA
ncbi:hypothetical protein G6F65_017667 [Rhizopus arrhizus]|nr:hypothetical protein G6F65_017667 [Rhizopus arrhizus]